MGPREIQSEVERLRDELAALGHETSQVDYAASSMERSLDELRAALLMMREPYDDPVLAPEEPEEDPE